MAFRDDFSLTCEFLEAQGVPSLALDRYFAKLLYNHLTCQKKRLRYFKGADHSLFHDINSQAVYNEILKWLDSFSCVI